MVEFTMVEDLRQREIQELGLKVHPNICIGLSLCLFSRPIVVVEELKQLASGLLPTPQRVG